MVHNAWKLWKFLFFNNINELLLEYGHSPFPSPVLLLCHSDEGRSHIRLSFFSSLSCSGVLLTAVRHFITWQHQENLVDICFLSYYRSPDIIHLIMPLNMQGLKYFLWLFPEKVYQALHLGAHVEAGFRRHTYEQHLSKISKWLKRARRGKKDLLALALQGRKIWPRYQALFLLLFLQCAVWTPNRVTKTNKGRYIQTGLYSKQMFYHILVYGMCLSIDVPALARSSEQIDPSRKGGSSLPQEGGQFCSPLKLASRQRASGVDCLPAWQTTESSRDDVSWLPSSLDPLNQWM